MAVDDLAAVLGLHPRRRLRLSGRAIVVVQPNVITPDERAGVQVGKPIHITPDGPEVLHRYPRKFVRCG
jgi:hypothetical protein